MHDHMGVFYCNSDSYNFDIQALDIHHERLELEMMTSL